MTEGTVADLWTPDRRQVLAAALEHLLPWSRGIGSEPVAETIVAARAEAVAAVSDVTIRTLDSPRFTSHAPWVLATLDELESVAQETAGQGFASLDRENREAVLRRLEGGDLVGGLRLLLQLGLEAYFGDPSRGGNPQGEAWEDLGLSREGVRRRLLGVGP